MGKNPTVLILAPLEPVENSSDAKENQAKQTIHLLDKFLSNKLIKY